MEKGVALLWSLKIDLFTANKSELATFALVNEKRITVVFLSIRIFGDHWPFKSPLNSADLFSWNSKYYHEKLPSENNIGK